MPRQQIRETLPDEQRLLFGAMDRHLRSVRESFGVRISARRDQLTIEGEDEHAVRTVTRHVRKVLDRLRRGRPPSDQEIEEILLGKDQPPPGASKTRQMPRPGRSRTNGGLEAIGTPRRAMGTGPMPVIQAKTPGQQQYLDAIRDHEVVVAAGPAGTGKTFLAVVQAVAALRSGEARRIVLTRPAVEAGEKLGFLPGDFQAKINPYLRPLYDALGDLMPWSEVQRYMDHDIIEIVPLAYMRGRTLRDAFIILDEAQNTTPAQMKMFLTRMGEGARIVITGDITQMDLPEGTRSGLVEAMHVLRGVRGIAVIEFAPKDIIRHPLVQRIVDAYDRHEQPLARVGKGGRSDEPTDTSPVEPPATPAEDDDDTPGELADPLT